MDPMLLDGTMIYLTKVPDEYDMAVLDGKQGLYMVLWKHWRKVRWPHALAVIFVVGLVLFYVYFLYMS